MTSWKNMLDVYMVLKPGQDAYTVSQNFNFSLTLMVHFSQGSRLLKWWSMPVLGYYFTKIWLQKTGLGLTAGGSTKWFQNFTVFSKWQFTSSKQTAMFGFLVLVWNLVWGNPQLKHSKFFPYLVFTFGKKSKSPIRPPFPVNYIGPPNLVSNLWL